MNSVEDINKLNDIVKAILDSFEYINEFVEELEPRINKMKSASEEILHNITEANMQY